MKTSRSGASEVDRDMSGKMTAFFIRGRCQTCRSRRGAIWIAEVDNNLGGGKVIFVALSPSYEKGRQVTSSQPQSVFSVPCVVDGWGCGHLRGARQTGGIGK